jgi:hypothetical protein
MFKVSVDNTMVRELQGHILAQKQAMYIQRKLRSVRVTTVAVEKY